MHRRLLQTGSDDRIMTFGDPGGCFTRAVELPILRMGCAPPTRYTIGIKAVYRALTRTTSTRRSVFSPIPRCLRGCLIVGRQIRGYAGVERNAANYSSSAVLALLTSVDRTDNQSRLFTVHCQYQSPRPSSLIHLRCQLI
ncbi:hypothetical protein J6590_056457 [Homalodisca vitripennis]|nr:hypothetical protein J6590_056457 [Homalodisca vitripennis]